MTRREERHVRLRVGLYPRHVARLKRMCLPLGLAEGVEPARRHKRLQRAPRVVARSRHAPSPGLGLVPAALAPLQQQAGGTEEHLFLYFK